MKEARIDEVLDSIAASCLVHFPDKPVEPLTLLKMNIEHRQEMGNFTTFLSKIYYFYNVFVS